jgi:small-conductance mechanosensitive channel
MESFLKEVMSLSLLGKCVAAFVGILIIHGGFRLLEQTVPRHFGRTNSRYKVRKFVVFSGYVTILLFLALLFEDRLGRLGFALGLVGAGVAVALQDVLASIAGAFSIGFSKLYAVGDRVQIGDTIGDVIDIGLLRTTLLETGNWVSKDSYNGRIVRVPNSAVLKGSVFNYSQGFQFVWDRIKVVFTTSSDFQFAKDMLTRVAREAIGDYLLEAQTSWKVVSDYYETVSPPLEPTVTLVVNAGNLEFDVSYVAHYSKRTAMQDQLFAKIVQEVAKSNGGLQWSSTPTPVIIQPPTPLPAAPQPPASAQGTVRAATSQ